MPVYEYRVVRLEEDAERAQEQLNALGLDGWMLAAHQPGTPNFQERGYFMRRPDEQPKPPATDPDADLPFE